LEEKRKIIFKGEQAEVVEKRLSDALTESSEAVETARAQAQDDAQELSARDAEFKTLTETLKDASQKAKSSHDALDKVLQMSGFAIEEAQQLLAKTAEWMSEQKDILEKLKAARQESEAVLKKVRAQKEAHQERDKPALSQEDCISQSAESEALAEEKRDERVLHQSRVEVDKRDRKKMAAELKQVEKREKEAEVWMILGTLVGSKDGAKFRRFAQSLTLELLLEQANEKVRDLTPRYTLMRVPGADLELQVVDKDMGDEIRGVKSLSGGESFLISLALALGLAALSSSKTQVESLFVDEGFGTLDAHNLDTVLAALDSLQATGRQIGVISHVPVIAERVGVRVHVESLGAGKSQVKVLQS
ncbi:nuclease SbcCD subunit C, partial [Myxococcota bacterium]|nr:nuclease SbcCD subunit C [Myxococcota bacterium]